MATVAVIKTGQFETFHDLDPGSEPSLGDVVRTTPILALLEDFEVHWYTSRKSLPLLQGVTGIERLIGLGDEDPYPDLRSYDLVVNLERATPWLQALAPVDPRRVIGFRREDGLLRSLGSDRFHSIEEWRSRWIAAGKRTWQDWLFALFARDWAGETYRIRRMPREKLWDVGLNWRIGSKWPSKALPKDKWQDLHDALLPRFSISWQQGHRDLEAYLAWIASCRLLMTHDSLGTHLALAMQVPTLVFFGSTSSDEVPLYGLGEGFRFGGTDPSIDEERVANAAGNWIESRRPLCSQTGLNFS